MDTRNSFSVEDVGEKSVAPKRNAMGNMLTLNLGDIGMTRKEQLMPKSVNKHLKNAQASNRSRSSYCISYNHHNGSKIHDLDLPQSNEKLDIFQELKSGRRSRRLVTNSRRAYKKSEGNNSCDQDATKLQVAMMAHGAAELDWFTFESRVRQIISEMVQPVKKTAETFYEEVKMGQLQVLDMKRKCDEMEFVMAKLNKINFGNDDTTVRQIAFETRVNSKSTEMANEIKGWAVRISQVEGKQMLGENQISSLSQKFEDFKDDFDSVIRQAQEINVQSQNLSLAVKSDLYRKNLDLEDRIFHLEKLNPRVQRLEELTAEEFVRVDENYDALKRQGYQQHLQIVDRVKKLEAQTLQGIRRCEIDIDFLKERFANFENENQLLELYFNKILPIKTFTEVCNALHCVISDKGDLANLISYEQGRYQDYIQEYQININEDLKKPGGTMSQHKRERVVQKILKTFSYDNDVPSMPVAMDAKRKVQSQSIFYRQMIRQTEYDNYGNPVVADEADYDNPNSYYYGLQFKDITYLNKLKDKNIFQVAADQTTRIALKQNETPGQSPSPSSQSSPNASVVMNNRKDDVKRVEKDAALQPKLMHADLFADDDFEDIAPKLERLIMVLKVALVKLSKEDRKLQLHSEQKVQKLRLMEFYKGLDYLRDRRKEGEETGTPYSIIQDLLKETKYITVNNIKKNFYKMQRAQLQDLLAIAQQKAEEFAKGPPKCFSKKDDPQKEPTVETVKATEKSVNASQVEIPSCKESQDKDKPLKKQLTQSSLRRSKHKSSQKASQFEIDVLPTGQNSKNSRSSIKQQEADKPPTRQQTMKIEQDSEAQDEGNTVSEDDSDDSRGSQISQSQINQLYANLKKQMVKVFHEMYDEKWKNESVNLLTLHVQNEIIDKNTSILAVPMMQQEQTKVREEMEEFFDNFNRTFEGFKEHIGKVYDRLEQIHYRTIRERSDIRRIAGDLLGKQEDQTFREIQFHRKIQASEEMILDLIKSEQIKLAQDIQEEQDRNGMGLYGFMGGVGSEFNASLNTRPCSPHAGIRSPLSGALSPKSGPFSTDMFSTTDEGGHAAHVQKQQKVPDRPCLNVSKTCLSCATDGQKPWINKAFKMACLTYEPGLINYEGQHVTKDTLFGRRARILEGLLDNQKILRDLPEVTFPDQTEAARRRNTILDTLGTLPDSVAQDGVPDPPLTPAKKPTPLVIERARSSQASLKRLKAAESNGTVRIRDEEKCVEGNKISNSGVYLEESRRSRRDLHSIVIKMNPQPSGETMNTALEERRKENLDGFDQQTKLRAEEQALGAAENYGGLPGISVGERKVVTLAKPQRQPSLRPILNNASELQEIQETGSRPSSTCNNDLVEEGSIQRALRKASVEMTNSVEAETLDANYGRPRALVTGATIEFPEVDTPYKIVSSNTIFNEPSVVDFAHKSEHAEIVNRAHLRPHTPIQRIFQGNQTQKIKVFRPTTAFPRKNTDSTMILSNTNQKSESGENVSQLFDKRAVNNAYTAASNLSTITDDLISRIGPITRNDTTQYQTSTQVSRLKQRVVQPANSRQLKLQRLQDQSAQMKSHLHMAIQSNNSGSSRVNNATPKIDSKSVRFGNRTHSTKIGVSANKKREQDSIFNKRSKSTLSPGRR